MGRTERRRRARHAKVGQPPGTAAFAGEPSDVVVQVEVIDYSVPNVRRLDAFDDAVLAWAQDPDTVTWVNVDGIHDAERIKAVCAPFKVHPLWIEDLLNPSTRAKAEALDDRLLVITRMARIVSTGPRDEVDTEQIAVVCGPGFLLSFQERPGDVFRGVRDRIDRGGRIRTMRSAYLLHALLDSVVDEYFLILEHLEGRVDALEDLAMVPRVRDLPARLHSLKQEIAGFRAVVWPLREAVAQLLRGEFELVEGDTLPFFRDLYDHVLQVLDGADSTRERLVGLLELHLAVMSHQMNLVMRLLTVVTTIFVPLTFVVGVYGMNFKYMPELGWHYGYAAVWAVMLAIGGSLGLWFRRQGWL